MKESTALSWRDIASSHSQFIIINLSLKYESIVTTVLISRICSITSVIMFQICTVLSYKSDVSCLSSDKKITALTQFKWFSRICSIASVVVFQTHTVLSSELNISCLSSGKKIMILTQFKWFWRICSVALQFASIFKSLLIYSDILSLNCFCTILITDVNKSALQYTCNEVCFIIAQLCNVNLFISWINSYKLRQLTA